MLKLLGAPLSNYYSMVKLALLEKGFDFEEIRTAPSQEPGYLSISPMGLIPCLQAREGFLSETDVILNFLEDVNTDIPLFPSDPYQRARARQIMRISELYIDGPLRPLLGGVFFGRTLPETAVETAEPDLRKGLAALGRVVVFDPWIAGSEFGCADIVAYYATEVASAIADAVYQWDISREIEGFSDWRRRVSERHFVHQIDTERQAAFAALHQSRSG
jgi:glutathione S-transferase